ncbi:MAG: NTP transferase domain-containing protein, partial [Actinomycetota bacterium]|nr:NTP transferase domain-containing protein [Actinomycetota bacterium]
MAAGRGERLGHALPKALVPCAGRPLLAWSLAALQAADGISQ